MTTSLLVLAACAAPAPQKPAVDPMETLRLACNSSDADSIRALGKTPEDCKYWNAVAFVIHGGLAESPSGALTAKQATQYDGLVDSYYAQGKFWTTSFKDFVAASTDDAAVRAQAELDDTRLQKLASSDPGKPPYYRIPNFNRIGHLNEKPGFGTEEVPILVGPIHD